MSTFHDNQILAAGDLIANFRGGEPFAVLLAQMQSGKTGTYLYTAFEMINQGLIDNVIIICGSADKSLRDQATADLEEGKDLYLQMVDPEENYPRRITKLYDNIRVFFSHDLKDAPPISDNTLIIHDESHMAQSRDNRPFKLFYTKNNLVKALMGDFSVLLEKKSFILGVSATPFSEIVSDRKVQSGEWTVGERSSPLAAVDVLEPKHFHFMCPGDGYIGVPQFLEGGSVKFEASEIKAESSRHFAETLRLGAKKYDNKFCVVRTHRAKLDGDMIESLATSCGYKYRSVFGGNGLNLDFMKDAPMVRTVIHICGRFRMGQVVPKQHIGMVYEQSKDPNADTILQGLLGRICGYESEGAHRDIEIFVSPKAEEHIHKYSRAWSGGGVDELTRIDRAMNLGGVKRRNGGDIITGLNKDGEMIDWIKTVPIRFRLSDLKDDGDETIKFARKHLTLEAITRLVQQRKEDDPTYPDIDLIEKTILDCAGPDGKLNLHNSKGDESKSYNSGLHYNTLYEASESWDSGKVRCNVSPSCPKGSAIWRNPFSILGEIGTTKECFLMGFIPYDPLIHPQDITEIAKVNPKCNYIPGEATLESGLVLENINGGQIITFSLETSEDPDIFEKELRASVCRTLEDHHSYIESCERIITSLYDKRRCGYEGIRLEKAHYNEEKISDIISRIERSYNIKLVFKKSRGRQPTDYIKYASISW